MSSTRAALNHRGEPGCSLLVQGQEIPGPNSLPHTHPTTKAHTQSYTHTHPGRKPVRKLSLTPLASHRPTNANARAQSAQLHQGARRAKMEARRARLLKFSHAKLQVSCPGKLRETGEHHSVTTRTGSMTLFLPKFLKSKS